jgi:site-specific DNA-methyltransferase (adenine-specific)
MMEVLNKIFLGDFRDILPYVPDASVDMLLTDLPYGVTNNSWDILVDMLILWREAKRVVKPAGAMVFTGQDMFTHRLIASNEKDFKYNLVWDKMTTTGFLNANVMPLRQHEDIVVFYRKTPVYNPQKSVGRRKSHSKGKMKGRENNCYGDFVNVDNAEENGYEKYPTSIIAIPAVPPSRKIHETQKPVPLFEYLIRTYTNPGDTVLDCCIGSGTTALAAIRSGRNYIGVELEERHYETCLKQISLQPHPLPLHN